MSTSKINPQQWSVRTKKVINAFAFYEDLPIFMIVAKPKKQYLVGFLFNRNKIKMQQYCN